MPIPDGVPLHHAAGLPKWLHGVVEPDDDRASVRRSTRADPRRRQRHRQPTASSGTRDRRQVAITAGPQNKLDLCAELGAEITIGYRDEDFVSG